MIIEDAQTYLNQLDAWKIEVDLWYDRQRQWAASGGYDPQAENPAGIYPPIPEAPVD